MAETGDNVAVTLRQVAEAAGVSVSTASRILDDRGLSAKSHNADRVREAADRLGYRRNSFASNLRRGNTATFGVLVPRLTDSVMALMFQAIETAASKHGYFAIVATAGDDAEAERKATERLLDRNVDGLILATARLDDELPASLRSRKIPHVLTLRTDGHSPSVLGDDETGGYLAARHLIDLGHRDIAIITGPWFTSSARERLAGARRAFTEAGLILDDARIQSVGYGIDDGIAAGHALFDSTQAPTAVFAANDNLAIGVLSAARSHGLSPAQDVSVIGYNDIPIASRLPVPLSSVRTHFDQIAARAVETLIGEPSSAGDTSQRVMPTFIPRASTARLS